VDTVLVEADPEVTAGLPTSVLVRFAHASVQAVADRVGADVLHIKGVSVDPSANPGRPAGTDADVLVRPAHVRRLMRGLVDHDWLLWCDFDEGSLFEHAASLHHDSYGMLDVHQNFPGFHHDPARAFETLWQSRVARDIGGVTCPAPGLLGEHLLLLLHAARSPGKTLDVDNHWTRLSPAERDEVRLLADHLGAGVGLALAIGEEDRVRHSSELELWHLMRDNSDRLGEWRARWRNTSGVVPRVRLLVRATRVNRFDLGQRLGRPPTKADLRRDWWRRARAGGRSVLLRARLRSREVD